MLTVTITNTIMSKTRNAGGGGGIPPSNTVAPVISGTAVVGQTLSSTTGTWIGTPIPTYTYQWYRGATPISGATSSTYTLVQADATFSVTCVVTATNPAGIASATSNALTIIDADAQAFFTASGLTGTTNQSAINKLVVDMKGYGIWTKMKAIYPFVGGTATSHKWNLKDPQDTNAAFRLVFSGGWTHSSTGAKPNGINGYADTFLNPNNYAQNSFAFGCYLRTLNSQNCYMGAFDSYRNYLLPISGQYYLQINSSGFNSTAVLASQTTRLHAITRTTSTTASTYINGSLFFNDNVLSDGKTNRNIYLGQLNNAAVTQYNSDNEHAFDFISDGLTGTEIANLTTAVNTYQTTLSRQV